MIVYEDIHFCVETGDPCLIPGYLILRVKAAARSLQAMPDEALRALGPMLARLSAAIEETVHPERLYTIRLGEEMEQIHFHLFPRTAAMAELYRSLHPDLIHAPINGARMFDWARQSSVFPQFKIQSLRKKSLNRSKYF